MTELFIDTENYCELDIRKVGSAPQLYHPSLEPLIWTYAFDDAPVQCVLAQGTTRADPCSSTGSTISSDVGIFLLPYARNPARILNTEGAVCELDSGCRNTFSFCRYLLHREIHVRHCKLKLSSLLNIMLRDYSNLLE